MLDSFKTRATLAIGSTRYAYHDLTRLEPQFRVSRLPYSYKILLENLLRHEDGVATTADDIADGLGHVTEEAAQTSAAGIATDAAPGRDVARDTHRDRRRARLHRRHRDRLPRHELRRGPADATHHERGSDSVGAAGDRTAKGTCADARPTRDVAPTRRARHRQARRRPARR